MIKDPFSAQPEFLRGVAFEVFQRAGGVNQVAIGTQQSPESHEIGCERKVVGSLEPNFPDVADIISREVTEENRLSRRRRVRNVRVNVCSIDRTRVTVALAAFTVAGRCVSSCRVRLVLALRRLTVAVPSATFDNR